MRKENLYMKKMMIENTIICVSWGDKYDISYVEKLKEQCEANCSIPFNFYCITDRPKLGSKYDINMPSYWDQFFLPEKNFFWAYRKCYMFALSYDDVETRETRYHWWLKHKYNRKHNETSMKYNMEWKNDIETKLWQFNRIQGEKFLFLDLDLIIHQDLKYFFDLPMDKPYIVRGWWNNIEDCKRNFAKYKATPLNSSVIRWNRGQLYEMWKEIYANPEMIFFTYPTIDNYFNHRGYDVWNEEKSFFQGFPKGDIYSWYKGNIFPEDMELKKFREDHKICLFNNSKLTTKRGHILEDEKELMYDIDKVNL